nr:YbaB/EbfC family nucleoid-associated protein [Rhodococcus sp. (in: high G+C Gram-positive bacteria)]
MSRPGQLDSLDALIARADRAFDVMSQASEGLSAVRVRRRSEDGLVTVTVDAGGAMVALDLAEDLSETSAAQLSSAIVTTASRAADEATDRRTSILEQMQSSLSDT